MGSNPKPKSRGVMTAEQRQRGIDALRLASLNPKVPKEIQAEAAKQMRNQIALQRYFDQPAEPKVHFARRPTPGGAPRSGQTKSEVNVGKTALSMSDAAPKRVEQDRRRMLTPSEIEALRRDAIEKSEYARKAF